MSFQRRQTTATAIAPLPHDWLVATWPQAVFPYDSRRARHLIRCNQDELIRFKALTRIGRTLVILGPGYLAWLESQQGRVADYSIRANAPEHAAKRFGGRDAAKFEEDAA
jgi:hypothetical protein